MFRSRDYTLKKGGAGLMAVIQRFLMNRIGRAGRYEDISRVHVWDDVNARARY